MTNPSTVQNQNSVLKKISTSFVSGITITALLLLIGNGGNIPWFPPAVVFPLVALTLLISVIFPLTWQILERKQKVNSAKIYGLLYTIIRYAIAVNLASFGWKKLFGLQFLVPDHIASQPMNRQTGEWLTWFYFGYSHTFGLLIAAIQLIGALLILYRRTLLFGLIVLFALMLNLMLINIFYQMNFGALLQSVITTIGILFLILLDSNRIISFFFQSSSNIHPITIPNRMKNILRASAILVALLYTIYLKSLL